LQAVALVAQAYFCVALSQSTREPEVAKVNGPLANYWQAPWQVAAFVAQVYLRVILSQLTGEPV
jgi:hypothetical protein